MYNPWNINPSTGTGTDWSGVAGFFSNLFGTPYVSANSPGGELTGDNFVHPVNANEPNGNFNDEESWKLYTDLLESMNLYNANQAELTRNFNKELRDTHLISMFDQLKKLNVNPILALGGNFNMPSYPSSASANAYTGSMPYSNAAKVDVAVINAISDVVNNLISTVGGAIVGKTAKK